MTIRPDVEKFIRHLEHSVQRKLNCPKEIGELLQIAVQTGLTNEFDELIFQAKFLIRSREVLSRIGSGAVGFEQLSAEFQSSVQKSIDTLEILLSRAPADAAQKFHETFMTKNSNGLESLMRLFSDLQVIKNLQNDGMALPYENSEPAKRRSVEKAKTEGWHVLLSRIQKSAGLAGIFFLFLVFLDPPVTTLGWILSLGIMGLLVYIVLQMYLLIRNPKP